MDSAKRLFLKASRRKKFPISRNTSDINFENRNQEPKRKQPFQDSPTLTPNVEPIQKKRKLELSPIRTSSWRNQISTTPSTSKNLANNRLRKLRNSLQLSAESNAGTASNSNKITYSPKQKHEEAAITNITSPLNQPDTKNLSIQARLKAPITSTPLKTKSSASFKSTFINNNSPYTYSKIKGNNSSSFFNDSPINSPRTNANRCSNHNRNDSMTNPTLSVQNRLIKSVNKSSINNFTLCVPNNNEEKKLSSLLNYTICVDVNSVNASNSNEPSDKKLNSQISDKTSESKFISPKIPKPAQNLPKAIPIKNTEKSFILNFSSPNTSKETKNEFDISPRIFKSPDNFPQPSQNFDTSSPLNFASGSLKNSSENIVFQTSNQCIDSNDNNRLKITAPIESPTQNFSNESSYSGTDLNSSLICNVNDSTQEGCDNDMEWSDIDQEELLSDIRLAREQNLAKPINNIDLLHGLSNNSIDYRNNVYIVVDTNVFIHKMAVLVKILGITYEDCTYPVIFVPWMVIQELDYFKEGYSKSSTAIQASSRKAIRFINECLMEKKPNFKGQSVRDAAEDKLKMSNPDDSILSCCFQLANNHKVMLLSSDVNLRNKAIINNFDSYSPEEICSVLLKKKVRPKFDLVKEVSSTLSLICTFILHSELISSMGQEWYNDQKFKELPWSFYYCMKYMKQYYNLVFKQVLQKQCLKIVDDLFDILRNTTDAPYNENKFVELCLSLLIYFKTGLPKYTRNIECAVITIKDLESQR